MSQPMTIETHMQTSLSDETRELDERLETYALGSFDLESERKFCMSVYQVQGNAKYQQRD
ncbi:MAG: hypothetical protein H6765_09570 [Candidatus Peribacteria bacterium]|nr:MAG: hypothetical protein H6765_09570 [Candidatus Peribacteria bacterium]